MIPEIPIIGSTDFKIKCPTCQNPIAGWVVTESNVFICPSCNQKLKSNFKTARKKAIILAIALYFVALITYIFAPQESNSKVILYIFGGIIPLFLGYVYFKILFKIKVIN